MNRSVVILATVLLMLYLLSLGMAQQGFTKGNMNNDNIIDVRVVLLSTRHSMPSRSNWPTYLWMVRFAIPVCSLRCEADVFFYAIWNWDIEAYYDYLPDIPMVFVGSHVCSAFRGLA